MRPEDGKTITNAYGASEVLRPVGTSRAELVRYARQHGLVEV